MWKDVIDRPLLHTDLTITLDTGDVDLSSRQLFSKVALLVDHWLSQIDCKAK